MPTCCDKSHDLTVPVCSGAVGLSQAVQWAEDFSQLAGAFGRGLSLVMAYGCITIYDIHDIHDIHDMDDMHDKMITFKWLL